ncbi:MAG: ATP-binding protein [Promethearchaeota archaeon]
MIGHNSKKNDVINDLLDIIINFSPLDDYNTYFDQIVKRIIHYWNEDHFIFFIIKRFTGIEKQYINYSIYYSQDRTDKVENKEIFLNESETLKAIEENRKNELKLELDSNLIELLKEINSSIEKIFSNSSGEILRRDDNIPIAFFLFAQPSLHILKTEEWEKIKKIINISVNKFFYLYKEKDYIQKHFSQIADKLSIIPNEDDKQSHSDVLQEVLDYTRKLLKVEKCALFLVDKNRNSLVLEKFSGEIDFEKIREKASYDIEEYNPEEKGTGITPWVLHRKKPFNAKNIFELKTKSWGHWKGNWDVPMYGSSEEAEIRFQCVYMTPLIVGNEAIGVLKYENRTPDSKKNYFDQPDERFIDLTAELLANLIMSQRIERNRYDIALPKISSAIVEYFGQPSFYEYLLEKCRQILNAQICSLFLLDDHNNLILKEIVGISEDEKYKLRNFSYNDYRNADGLTPWILRQKSPFNVRTFPDLKGRSKGKHIGKWDNIVYHGRPEKEFKSLYSIPLIIAEEPIGVFKIENKEAPPYYFTESDERLFDLIGRLIVIAVKYENEKYLGLMIRAAELGFLASGIAHEFNNSLQIFLNKLILAEEYSINKSAKEKINEITKEISKTSKIIDNFRQIKNRKPEVKEFSLQEKINQIIDFNKQRFFTHNIEIKYINKEDIEIVKINQSEFQTILINLLNNAFESIMESKKPKGIIDIIIKEAVGNNFCLEIYDSGKGITEEEGKHLFTPFYTTKAPKGMGMGLFWVNRVVKSMEGRIEVELKNEYGGATFKVYLPKEIKINDETFE